MSGLGEALRQGGVGGLASTLRNETDLEEQ